MRHVLERFRFVAFAIGCALLFWQLDASPADGLFALAIVASAALWQRGAPGFDLAPPQPLLFVFLSITALATTLAGGSRAFLAITIYLALACLALAAALKQDPRRLARIELAVAVAACISAVTVCAGAMVWNVGLWPSLHVLAMDPLRGKGLFKDANAAGAFLACSYPIAAAYCLRLHRRRTEALLLVSGLLLAGVIYSYSRLALGLFGLALVAVIAVLVASRERRLLLALGGCVLAGAAAVGLAIALGRFPLSRYEPIHDYDANGRFVAWRFGVDMIRQTPLGSGSGTFERRTAEYSEELVKRDRIVDDGSAVSENLVRNGGLDGFQAWTFDSTALAATVIDDPTSPTGRAVRKNAVAEYQDVAQLVRVVPGRTYSFAAQIRSDGSPALLIVHWYDDNGTLLAQAGTDPSTSSTWTEAALQNQTAPPTATQAVVFLSNQAAGEQYFAAIRMVEGSSAPEWSSLMQWGAATAPPPGTISAHNTYLRLAVESGLPGLLAFCAYALALLASTWKRRRESWQWLVAYSLVLVAGFVIDTLHWRMLWISAAAVAAAVPAASAHTEAAARRGRGLATSLERVFADRP